VETKDIQITSEFLIIKKNIKKKPVLFYIQSTVNAVDVSRRGKN